MRPAYISISGTIIFGATFLAWRWINAFACGMNPTGCDDMSLAWHDWEALQFFLPTFVIGALAMAVGLWRMR